jgi:predicted Ser/Thr protein kinase
LQAAGPGPDTVPSAAPPSREALPRSFGDFELLEEVARGGMGVVFKARQRSLNRTVAVKMILHGALAAPDSLRRFEMEARAAAALDHANIVPVHEFGHEGGRPFLVMPFVEGESLGALVTNRGPRPWPEAVALLLPVAEAVRHAHQAGIIHRDLKPENVLIDRQGRPRVTDFGLAKHLGDAGPTRDGQIMGTPAYMAPEQAFGDSRHVGPEADVYGLGGILYFLLTGRPPFAGKTMSEVLLKVVSEPATSPRSLNPDIPAAVETVVLCCLEKEPESRFPGVPALLDALRVVAGEPPAARPAAPRGRVEDMLTAIRKDPPERPPAGKAAGAATAVRWPKAPSRRLLALLVLAALALGAGIGVWKKPDWFVGPEAGPSTSEGQPKDVGPANEVVDIPEPSRYDFPLKVELIGATRRPDGVFEMPRGTVVQLKIEVGRDAYVGVWTVDPRGTIVQLFPNWAERDHRIKAKAPHIIPGTQEYEVVAEEVSTGVEQLRVVAATRYWNPPMDKTAGLMTFQTLAERKKVAGISRELALRPRSGNDLMAETALKYVVLPPR